MGKRSTMVRKRFVRKLGISLNRYFKEPKYVQVVFEEWPTIDDTCQSVVFVRVLEDDWAGDDDRFGTTLTRSETVELIKFLEAALANTP